MIIIDNNNYINEKFNYHEPHTNRRRARIVIVAATVNVISIVMRLFMGIFGSYMNMVVNLKGASHFYLTNNKCEIDELSSGG